MATNRAEFKIREAPGVVATAGRTNIFVNGSSIGDVRTLDISAGPNVDLLSAGDTDVLTLTISADYTPQFTLDGDDLGQVRSLDIAAGPNIAIASSGDESSTTFTISADYTTEFKIGSGLSASPTFKRNVLNLIPGDNMKFTSAIDAEMLSIELSSKGEVGPQGDQGHQGFQGLIGDQGPQGIIGPQGFQGVSGTGPQGVQGTQGNQGERGYQGPPDGDQGDPGEQGTQGPTGLTGPRGLDSPGPSVVRAITAANNFKPGDVIRYDGLNYVTSIGNDPVSATVIGVVSSATTSDFKVVTHGYIDSLSGVTYANEIKTTYTTDITGVITMSTGEQNNEDGSEYRVLTAGDFYPQMAGGNGTLSGNITYPSHPNHNHNIGDFGHDDIPPLTDTFTGTFSSPSITALPDQQGVYVVGTINGKNSNNLNEYLITDISVRGYIDLNNFGTGQLHLTAFDWPTHILGLEPGEVYYLSNTSQGEAISAAPTTLGHYVKPLMYAISNSSAYVNVQTSIEIEEDVKTTNSNVHTVTQADHGFNVGSPIYFDGIEYQRSHCIAGSAAEMLGIIQSTTTDTFTYVSDGAITFDTNYFSMAPGSVYFLAPSAGILQTSEPIHEGYISKPVLYSISMSAGIVKNYRGIAVAGVTGPIPDHTHEDPVARNNILLLWMEHSIRDALTNGEAQDGDHDVFVSNTVHGLTPVVEKVYHEEATNGFYETLNDSYSAVYPQYAAGRSVDAVYDPTLDLYHNKRTTLYRHVFHFYGSDKSWTIPVGLDSSVTDLSAYMWGAGGGGGGSNNVASLLATGGPGGYTSGILPVTGGETLTMIIGHHGKGSNNTTNLSGHFDSPGINYSGGAEASTINAAGEGGGRTAIRRGSTELITAGGGGGAGTGDDGRGGAGNGGSGFTSGSAQGGGGGLTASGGVGASGSYDATPQSGTQFAGGAHSTDAYGGAGGGGGYYGGGAGGSNYGVDNNAGGAGGGSGYIDGVTSGEMLSSNTTAPPNSGIDQYGYHSLHAGYYDKMAGVGGERGERGGNGLAVVEYETLKYTNMIITSEPVSSTEIPTKSRVVLLYNPEVDTSLNTDIKLFVSRNNGANWEETVLSYEGMYDDTYQIIAGTGAVGTHALSAVTDFEGLSSVPVMRWKIQMYNNKYQKIKGVAQMWS